ncbi:MAG: PilT/PilU family type 4a pilus ATPase [Polyangiales bacterium]
MSPPNSKPPLGARPLAPRPPTVREEVVERPSRPVIREEIPIPVERPSRVVVREEIPIPAERPSRVVIREEIPLSPPQPMPAVQPAGQAPVGGAQLTPQLLQQIVQQVRAQVEQQVRGELAATLQSELHERVAAQVQPLQAELEALRKRVAEQPAAPAAPSPAAPSAAAPAAPSPAPAEPAPVTAAKPALPTTAPGTPGKNRIDRFLKLMSDRGASDLHLSVGRPPIFRLGGRMEPIRYRTLDDGDFTALLQPIAPAHLWADYVANGDTDFAYDLPGVCRFRVNVFKQQRGMGAVLRVIPTKLLTVQQLGLPDVIRKVVALRSGLVLVTGPTGSGKSTTLSAIINEMNETRPMHFVTIEDPIEFVHPNKKSLMTQREVGPHSKSFSTALRAAVREDPDAILVGEMRDLETISMALNAAETGVLVFGTLHTNSAAKTLDRIINVFPADKQPGVRGTLASVTKCVVAQQLLRKKGGGRAAAVEILFASNAMSAMIRDGKTHQISGLIKLGKRDGMIAMDDALKKLVEDDLIEPTAGLEKSIDKDDFRKWLKERGAAVPDDDGHGGH